LAARRRLRDRNQPIPGSACARKGLCRFKVGAKGLDHLQPLYRLIHSGNLPRPAVQRLLQEAHKIEEAAAWASRYRRAVAAGTSTLDDLPSWAQAYRETLADLLPR
jgi:hypothetical protein